jgi:nucleoside-diphosphate-sugar epimerase
MKVLVTGGTGFVGAAVIPALVNAGHGIRIAMRNERVPQGCDAVTVGDIGPLTEWGPALQGIDAVVHLAGRAHVMHDHAQGAEEFRRTNALGTLRLARAAAEAGASRFVFVSTVKVNGEATTRRPFHADDAADPIDPYGRSKHEAEVGLRQIAGLQPVIIRPPLVHGPGARGNLARFCRLAVSGLPVPFGSIHNRRDLVGVANLASLVERCLTHPAAPGEVFLVSDGEPLSTPELYRMICDALGRPARIYRMPIGVMRALARPVGMSGEVDRLTQSLEVDITKTRELLGWNPPVGVATGIAEMARAFRAGRP